MGVGEIAEAKGNPFRQYMDDIVQSVPSLLCIIIADVHGTVRLHGPVCSRVVTALRYAGSHIFALARQLGIRNTIIAGAPPAMIAAFIPNAIGMGAFTLVMELNKTIETTDEEEKIKTA
ncbi:hypothetical protein DIPPA_10521 [Diplonema papillatum]|nr:hypothetical protein DIPPA_10521 [Diplonema papillatum]